MIRVPASTSNLGSGFDCVGLALDRYLEVRYTPGAATLAVERTGELAGLDDADDLFVQTLRRQASNGAELTGHLRIRSEIPTGRGLGSSGTAVVAGLLLARHVSGGDASAEALLPAALAAEGHPDNVTPALMGGLVTITVADDGGTHALRHTVSPDLAFAFAAPGVQLATARARAALPPTVRHEVARRSLSRLPALLRGLATADPTLLRAGFADELHVPYRLPLIPGSAHALAAGLQAGAWAVTVSGAGSGLIAVCAPDLAPAVAEAMRAAFEAAPGSAGGIGFAARVDEVGASVDYADDDADHVYYADHV